MGLFGIPIKNWHSALNEAVLDDKAGIRIAKLVGNDDFSMYVTEILPKATVNAHYHSHGIEIYHILSGQGVIYTGAPINDNQTNWNESAIVKDGDFFVIEPGMVHQLKNPFEESLILIFGCPISHLSTDRVVVTNL
jgi:quercetin dioxygenase-like cupin family protein